MITTHWTCSCGSVNGLGRLKCACCGTQIPREVCELIYKEELAIQKDRYKRETCEKHSRFWQRNERKFGIARKACGVFCVLLVGAFIGSFYGHRYILRMDDVFSRCEEIGDFATNRAESIEIQQREEEVEITIFKRFENADEEEINNDLQKLGEHIEKRFQQISDAKERLLNYVN